MKLFDTRQKLTDATTISNLKLETELTKELAKAIGDENKQRQIQLEFDIKKAQREAAPSSAAAIDSASARTARSSSTPRTRRTRTARTTAILRPRRKPRCGW